METVKSLNKWANAHTYYSLDILRIIVGVFLFWKGVSFLTNTEYYNQLSEPIKNLGGGMLIVHYVVAAHMMGGIMIIVGLLTRWAIAAQLPILLGAFLVNFIGEMNVGNMILSFLLFVICVFFLFYGSGKHSADYYFKMQQ
ncbi:MULTISPECIES: DoxX family protein [Flavobacterium]|uniref:DoxX family protein n=1 Tax=Flavobacterium hankyongi TaxID=1176532 RepID=A0ABP9A319_9FLAO|nr:DoxX family protein [Flavobacterium sp. N1846]